MSATATIADVLEGRARWCVVEGDCVAVLATVPDKSISLTVTSPPYNQMSSVTGQPSGIWGASDFGRSFCDAWASRGYSDEMPEADYQTWQNAVLSLIGVKSTDTASLFYNHQLRWRDGVCLHPVAWCHPDGWRMRQEIVWNRGGGMMFNARMFVRFDERILWFVRGSTWAWSQESVGLGTVWNIAREQQSGGKEHPVAYPIELPLRSIAATSNATDVVLDPFAGSGTTGVAALRLGRRAILIEREPKYAAICRERMAAEAASSTLQAARAGQEPLFGAGR